MDALNWRYAVKTFDPSRKISRDKLDAVMEAARLAPSSFGLQPYHLILIEDRDIRKQLREVSYNQSQITDCSDLIVFQIEKRMDESFVDNYVELISKTRGVGTEVLKDFRDVMVNSIAQKPETVESQEWCKRQAYIAMGFMLYAAAVNKVDACPMEGINGAEYDRILDATDLHTIAVVALGYRSPNDQFQHFKKVRQPKEKFFSII